jgi:hypothetical protein
MLPHRRLLFNKWNVQECQRLRGKQLVLAHRMHRQNVERPSMPEILRTDWYAHSELATMPASVLTPAEPTRNTGLVFNCLKKESWCCAYVGEKGLKGWSSRASINTTCCAIDDLTFQAEDPIVYATATAPIKLSIQSTSTAPATIDGSSTLFSSIALTATSATEMDISGLPTSDSGESAGNATQDQSSSSSSSSSSSEGLGTGAKIGLGVGIPLAVIGLAAIGAFFWLQRRRKTLSTKEDGPHLLDSSAASKQTAPPYQETSANQQGSVVYRHEAPSKTPAVELPATTDMAELPPQGKR